MIKRISVAELISYGKYNRFAAYFRYNSSFERIYVQDAMVRNKEHLKKDGQSSAFSCRLAQDKG
jgi:hypothetical protein